jgi:hypothetical protein
MNPMQFEITKFEPSAVGSRAGWGLRFISVVMNVGFVSNAMPSSLVLIMFTRLKWCKVYHLLELPIKLHADDVSLVE